MKNGHFVISLDYELHWGLFDLKTVEEYNENLSNVGKVIERLLVLSDQYNIKLTFATVGFLFARDKEELIKFSPKKIPSYTNKILSPYAIFDSIGNDETDDPFHFGSSTIKKIQESKNHEIGTHTFSHYYCNEPGQTNEEFEEDMKAVVNVAHDYNLKMESIVYPRNMINNEYQSICKKHGIKSYRGTEKAFVYNIDPIKPYYNWLAVRGYRILDSYLNLTGNNIYDVLKINNNKSIINLPSSRFLRPYNKLLRLFEPLKIRRVIKGMRKAAKRNEMFHLWWHPHNFGKDIDKNLNNLEKIFSEYKSLSSKYNFSSETMTSLTNKVLSSFK